MTVEEIVDTDVLRRDPDRTVLPGFVVDAVVEVPYGAHPTSLHPRYTYDTDLHLDWSKAARDDATAAEEFLQRYVLRTGRPGRVPRRRRRGRPGCWTSSRRCGDDRGERRTSRLAHQPAIADDYTVDELMIAYLASCFPTATRPATGWRRSCRYRRSCWPASRTRPDLFWLAGAAGLDPRPAKVPASTLESQLWGDSVMYLEQYGDFWTYALNGRWLQKFCVGAAQLDAYGNANNSVIGSDYHQPKVRLPGTAGLGDMGSIGKTLYYWNPNHNPRALVERVDFVSCAGYLGGG